MIEIDSRSLLDRLGVELAVSDWLDVTQARINQFADATDDHLWIHIDAARAAAETPFKTTIAHGFLTLSLVTPLLFRTITFPTARLVLNYGVNRVRFVTPVPAGSRIRGRFSPASVTNVDGGVQIVWSVTIEREGQEKPCAVVEWLVRYYTT
jgi:acyl dehydratase